jgi:GAF domain-containing protein
MPAMKGAEARLPFHLALFAIGAVAMLSGAAFILPTHVSGGIPLVTAAALLAFASGIFHRKWNAAGPLAVGSLLFLLAALNFNLQNPVLGVNLLGLVCLFGGGVLGKIAYTSLTGEMRQRLSELAGLNARLEEQHRFFLAATEDHGDDVAALVANTARQAGAGFGCLYLVASDGSAFVPQLPGFGMDRLQPASLNRRRDSPDPLLSAIEANREFQTFEEKDVRHLFSYIPPKFNVDNALVVPMRVGDHIGGFVLLGNKQNGFSLDDQRLAMTLTMRAGLQLASARAVAVSRIEAARYALFNEMLKQSSGLSQEEVLELVISRGRELIGYDAGRALLFHPDDSYVVVGAPGARAIGDGPLRKVVNGETVIRKLVTAYDGLFSAVEPASQGGQVAEALVPVRGKESILGAICLGRAGGLSFGGRDVATLEELGAMAGVAVENSRIVQQISGQASKLDTALEMLGEVSHALTAVTEGESVLEHKTLEAAARLNGCRHALLTQAIEPGRHRVTSLLGFPDQIEGMEFNNGQGLIGAVILSGRPTVVPDTLQAGDLSHPPDLAALGLRAAACVPMFQGNQVWGTLSIFDGKPRKWSEDDLRVLSMLGNEAVVAVKNAELYDSSRKMIWELTNLHEGLTAVTGTLDMEQVLELVLGWAAKASDAQIGAIALEERGRLQLVGAYGTDFNTARRLALEVGGEICLDVMASGKPFMEAAMKEGAAESPLEPRAVLCVPISLRETPIGVVFLANYVEDRRFNDDHKRLVTALAAQAAVAIDNARLFKEREDVILSALNALAAAVDARDPYTAGHSDRVTDYALSIARQMGYAIGDEEAWRRLKQGTRLHDIGKIGVPDAVLSKPGRLTKEEFEVMKRHPMVGFEVLKSLKMLSDELVIVRSHHERWDGRGYPDGLSGPDLPLFAWIVGAADAFDAMTSDRPYRRGMGLEVALAELEKGAGSQFHPEVARAAIEAARVGKLKIIPAFSHFQDAPVVGAFENPTE